MLCLQEVGGFHVPVTGPHCVLARLCPGGWKGAPEALEQEEQQKTGPLPGAGSCRNSTQTDPQPGKCKFPGETGEELGETAGAGGFGEGTLNTGNISPGEAGGQGLEGGGAA